MELQLCTRASYPTAAGATRLLVGVLEAFVVRVRLAGPIRASMSEEFGTMIWRSQC